MKKLSQLLQALDHYDLKNFSDETITFLTGNSKQVIPGSLFIARKGSSFNGIDYVPEALLKGAVAVLTEEALPDLSCIQIVHSNLIEAEALLAETFYDFASQDLFVVGLTGTNGKTTTSFIIKHLLDCFLEPCGLIGTIENIVGFSRFPANRTTPDVITNHHLLYQMVQEGCRSVVMEVTSHGLDQKRINKIDVDVALFSNLTQDHLDYHKTMENYCQAKNSLFRQLGQLQTKKSKMKWAVVNADSPWVDSILEGSTASVLKYGIEQKADLQASDIVFTTQGTQATLTYQEKSYTCWWPLVGRFNVYNCLGAIAVLLTQKIDFKEIIEQVRHIPCVKGRLQPVSNHLGLKIYIDYAHTDDALLNVLETLKEVKPKLGRLLVLFGCGGDRDRTKRPKMAQAVERLADYGLVTSDNPRSEDPLTICQEIVAGFSDSFSFEIEIDRRLAIHKILSLAKSQDIILIAGKGHENYQIFADKTIDFDDHQVTIDICHQFTYH